MPVPETILQLQVEGYRAMSSTRKLTLASGLGRFVGETEGAAFRAGKAQRGGIVSRFGALNPSGVGAPDPVAPVLRRLEDAGLEYMLTEAVGEIVYGEPWLRNEIAIVLRLSTGEADHLVRQFPSEAFYVPPLEAIRTEATRARDGYFGLLDLETMLRADVHLVGFDPLQNWGLRRRRRVLLGAVEGWVAPPEYVIVQKLIYFKQGSSSKHLRDIACMLRVSEALIDRPLLERKVRELGLDAVWATALATPLDA